VSERFVWVASKAAPREHFPLLLGLCLEVYLVSVVVAKSEPLAVALALALVFGLLWIGLPRRERGVLKRDG
jgi:ABC-type transport system involved in cytochrome c biogenesis permease subunit